MNKIKIVKNIPQIKIDKNIPVPQPIRHGRPRKYPFDKMAAGDSFFVGENENTVASAAYAYASGNGKKFVCRTQVGGGLRVWRTK